MYLSWVLALVGVAFYIKNDTGDSPSSRSEKQKAVKKKADLKKTLGPKGLSRVMRRTRRLKDAQGRAVEARGAEENWTDQPFDLDPPDAAAAASAPAPAEVNAAPDERAAPVLVGDWLEVHVDGGTLKWSPSIGALDAHCVGHVGGELCRMNRKFRAAKATANTRAKAKTKATQRQKAKAKAKAKTNAKSKSKQQMATITNATNTNTTKQHKHNIKQHA